ncbi:DUF3278 domain-containing protein [Convivina praedatoris]|uniref:Uncharacterized protein n=1 Tax=Convivina praedatoris TaxID=2880963 RepID=A0ABM9D1V2_9LACO|nr:DUF3278 domain-containing protein [Convivina sp. LMG 32447]CAH1852028.1 hypothetical protein LMG032447_00467 [Convivina sp. LMG 32447]CAH1852054.1 hypothetical protein R078138_00477 [Convivina sp. LMG 32447]CAH1852876.1 hypothetical protein R077815_00640 [Convivina sp. LMG 32447]
MKRFTSIFLGLFYCFWEPIDQKTEQAMAKFGSVVFPMFSIYTLISSFAVACLVGQDAQRLIYGILFSNFIVFFILLMSFGYYIRKHKLIQGEDFWMQAPSKRVALSRAISSGLFFGLAYVIFDGFMNVFLNEGSFVGAFGVRSLLGDFVAGFVWGGLILLISYPYRSGNKK